MKSARNKGFTLIEAMVSAALVAIGVASAMGAYGALTKAQSQIQERDRMQRLAISKYDELIAGGLGNAASSGDFQDYNDGRYKWSADIANTATTGLQSLTLTVTSNLPNDSTQVSIEGLLYNPTTTATGGTGAAGG
jgi:prepilin-type N-terminal cleavage/methylation domain